MQIKIHKNFKKRLNSTKRPTGGTTIDVVLKEECTVENPIFILNGYDASIDYIEAFGKYYFVDKKNIIDNSRCEYACVEDYLATGKSDIGNTTALIARSSSNYNKYLNDDMVSITVNKTNTGRDAYTMPFDKDGCFILSVVNDESSATNYVCNYICDASILEKVALWLSGQGTYDSGVTWADIETYLMLQFGDCFDCIRSLKWIPVSYGTVASVVGARDVVRIGKYNVTGARTERISKTDLVEDYDTIDLSDILPDDFRAAAPYSSVDVYLPYYGLVSLPPEQCRGEIGIKYSIDPSVGDCLITITTTGMDNEKILASIHYDIGVDMPIAQVGRNLAASISAGSDVLGNALMLNPIGTIQAGVGLISAVASNGVSCKGSLGGRAFSTRNEITAFVTVCNTTLPDDLLNLYGRPCMEVVQISSLSGYVQCVNASVASNLTQSEIAKINGMLNEGFYYE